MNSNILSPEVQDFIEKNSAAELPKLILKGSPFTTCSIQEIAQQIDARQRASKKLPSWVETPAIYFPPRLAIEQCSSEACAKYKASLISGKQAIDLTGGFGVDTFYFSKQFETVTHCEIQNALSDICKHNFKMLGSDNIKFYVGDSAHLLANAPEKYDWIYLDPARRDLNQRKVYRFADCTPDIPELLPLLFEQTNHILVKASPLLDIQQAANELTQVRKICVVALNNECKELLFIMEKGYDNEPEITCTELDEKQHFEWTFTASEERNLTVDLSLPLNYLYEPSAAILKAGAFKTVAQKTGCKKLHVSSHLYTSTSPVDFPGKRFKIEAVIPYRGKRTQLPKAISKANIVCRNFTERPEELYKKLKIKPGGNDTLFFTTDLDGQRVVIHCLNLKRL